MLQQKRTSISREVGNVALATRGEDCTRRGDNFQILECLDEGCACTHYRASDEECYKASDGGHRNEGFPLLCTLPYFDAPQATTCIRSTAFFVFVSFVLGIRAASASQTHPTHVPIVASICSLKSSDVKAKLDQEDGKVSKVEANGNVQCTTPRRNFQDDQGHTLQDCNYVAYDGYNDSMYKIFEDSFLEDERMPTVLSEPQIKTTVNKSSRSNGTIRERGEKSVEDKVLEEGFQEWASAPYKLMVPLRVVGLRGSVPPIWLKDFMLSQGKRVKITFESQGDLKEIMSALGSVLKKKQVTPRSIVAADIVTLGDSWLHAAVSGRLIQPIDNAEQHEWFNRLGPKWQAFLRRDQDGCLDPKGLIWGAPYRWGSMVIAYRTDKLSKNNIPGIEDWKDLWKPELTGKIAMVDSSREVVGAVLKSLGASYNTQDFDKDVKGGRAAVKQQFLALQKQVKVFDSVYYLKALASDDVWVAVGWSNDVIPVAKRMSNVRVVAPKSGASLWADLWTIPAANSIPSSKIGSRVYGASPLTHQWFDFCLQPARGLPFEQGVFVGASPLNVLKEDCEVLVGKHRSVDDISGRAMEDILLAGNSRTNGPAMDTNMIEGMPPEYSLQKSELLEPLSEKAVVEYRWLFSQAAEQGNFREGMLEIVKQFVKVVSSRSGKKG